MYIHYEGEKMTKRQFDVCTKNNIMLYAQARSCEDRFIVNTQYKDTRRVGTRAVCGNLHGATVSDYVRAPWAKAHTLILFSELAVIALATTKKSKNVSTVKKLFFPKSVYLIEC